MGCHKRIIIALGIMLTDFLFLGSCSSVQAGLYLVSIDNDNGETILQNEQNVKIFLENIFDLYEDYTIRAFARTGVNFQVKRTKLLTHSFYLIISNNQQFQIQKETTEGTEFTEEKARVFGRKLRIPPGIAAG